MLQHISKNETSFEEKCIHQYISSPQSPLIISDHRKMFIHKGKWRNGLKLHQKGQGWRYITLRFQPVKGAFPLCATCIRIDTSSIDIQLTWDYHDYGWVLYSIGYHGGKAILWQDGKHTLQYIMLMDTCGSINLFMKLSTPDYKGITFCTHQYDILFHLFHHISDHI